MQDSLMYRTEYTLIATIISCYLLLGFGFISYIFNLKVLNYIPIFLVCFIFFARILGYIKDKKNMK